MKTHPFEKFFSEALRQSTRFDNRVREAAEGLLSKGYPTGEVRDALRHFAGTLIADTEREIALEALQAVEAGID